MYMQYMYKRTYRFVLQFSLLYPRITQVGCESIAYALEAMLSQSYLVY